MKFRKGTPANDETCPDEAREICAQLDKMLRRTGHPTTGWYEASVTYHVDSDGNIDLIGDIEAYRLGDLGCGKRFAPGQWWGYCGETDMGQSAPALCTECGGEYRLDDAAP